MCFGVKEFFTSQGKKIMVEFSKIYSKNKISIHINIKKNKFMLVLLLKLK